jgi:hypothetical protein
MITVNRPLFQLGKIVATPGALEALEAAEQNLWELLNRHSQGDFGDVCNEDAALNHEAVNDGGRILSAYILPRTKEKVWIITEADRSSSCCLRPDEY